MVLLKYFLSQRGLNETYTGGLGSYCIILLSISFYQVRKKKKFNLKKNIFLSQQHFAHYYSKSPIDEKTGIPEGLDLGKLFLGFLHFYGNQFNYYVAGISVRGEGKYFRKVKKKKKIGINKY